jgi:hypothetical protein
MRPIFGSIFALFVLGFSHALLGQAVTATLLGTVTDSTGATIANAKVTATEAGTGALHLSVTNESGNFTIPDLQPGPYTLTVEAKGFKKATQENIDVASNSSTRVDLTLVPGNASETIVVTTAPPALQTDRADISTKIESVDLVDMALGTNRNFQSLLNVVPGTAPAVFQHSQFFNAASALQTEANGLPREGNLYQIEGIDDDERTGLLQIIIPPAEAIASVDISTNNFEAELGRATGAVTNVTLKSGTNNVHGSAFEFIQNNDLNARPYFSTIPLGHLSYNYFGGAVGGPIFKDKLFYFGDYLHTTDHEAISNTFTIPDSRYYTASTSNPGFIDLSSMFGAGSNCSYGTAPYCVGQIFDPTTYTNGTAHIGTAADPRPAFKNNQIPVSLVNPVSLAILQDVDAAAAEYGVLTTKPMLAPTNNYSSNLPFTKTTDSFDTKIDYTPTEKNHLSGRFSFQRVVTFQSAAFGAFLGGPAGSGFEGTGDQKAYSTGANYDHVFSPTFFTEARVGVAHLRNNAQTNDYGTDDATTLGISGVNISGQPFTSGQTNVSICSSVPAPGTACSTAAFSNPLMGYSASEPWIRGEANIDFVNIWTKIRGNHTIKAGMDLRRVRDDLLQDQTFSPRGAYTFADAQTSEAGATTNIANYTASFLLDQPTEVGRDLNTFFPCYRQWWFFAFASDKWQATPKMTVDLGVRWEFYPPATPKSAGGFSNYNPVNNTLVLAGLSANPSNLGMTVKYKNFAPRTGISYRLRNDTVVRAGFGISYTPFPDNTYAYDYPVRSNLTYASGAPSAYTPAEEPVTTSTSSCPATGGEAIATFQCGFPAPATVPIPSNGIIQANTTQLIDQSYNVIGTITPWGSYSMDYRNPYAESWNVAVEQAFRGNLSLQVAYVANHGVRIDTSQNINLPSTYGGGSASDPEDTVAYTGGATGRTAGTFISFMGFSSNYESLQTQLTKRISHGLTFTSGFTWGKGLDYMNADDGGGGASSGLQFYINQRRNYAPTDFDRKTNFEQTLTYDLPAGRGHKLLDSGVGDAVLGGWKLSGLVSIVSGMPFTVQASTSSLNTPGTAQTATLTGSFKALHGIGSASPWFQNDQGALGSSATWQQPTGCTGQSPCTAPVLGNTGRNQFRGPGYIQDNASLFKKFTLFRETALEFRIDAFQLSNTPQFGQPSSTITSSSFGEVTSTLGSGQGSVNGVGGGRTLQGSLKITF